MQQHIERIAKGSSVPRNGKEGILFSFIMSAIMIYVMAALNYGVRIGDVGAAAWSYALFDWPLAYVVGMICDLCICTPSSRAIMNTFCAATDRAVWKGITVKFLMVVLMTVFGAIMAFGFTFGAFTEFWRMFPYNFTIAFADSDADRRTIVRQDSSRHRRCRRMEQVRATACSRFGCQDRCRCDAA